MVVKNHAAGPSPCHDCHGDDMLMVAVVKGNERYVFLFSVRLANEAIARVWRFACDPKLSFTQRDADVVAQTIRARVKMPTTEERAGQEFACRIVGFMLYELYADRLAGWHTDQFQPEIFSE